MIEVTTHIGFLSVNLFIPEAQSLKEKRMVLRKLKDKIRNKFNVSLSEIDGQDKWQYARLGFVMIGTDNRYIDGALQNLLSLIDSYHAVEVTETQMEFI